jgi:hypothetical protein
MSNANTAVKPAAKPEPDPVCDACGGPVVADDALCFACADDEDAKFAGGWALGDD